MDEPAWAEEDAGPIVRPYALTGGRTRHDSGAVLDLVDLIVAGEAEPTAAMELGPEHLVIRRLAADHPSVAEVAADLDLPVDVVRVLLGDLLRYGLIRVRKPASVSRLPDARLLKEVMDGLSAL
ncbi:DUF742 domain-containing protein [Actinocorallia sp. A-T 12471]|uniref:DUF742 domain-containing protein n=1 Tax=Actinocorallia sp. A-T 12471 TaxID=3089813 RepID=UPI0029CE051A|nr:DUF742 domain-containing protein [Actinocorallia sp. A-T 12471]MDX6742827.1 DUF742 domain-containing protein [Actinocorallia sp. A-T 12471]